jgi:hypothetical protein
LAALGDIDGDGAWDFAVGQPGYSIGVVNHGRVQVISGKTGAQIYEYIGQPYSGLGAVAGLGDVDGDLVPDFAMGASAGFVWVVSGATGTTSYTLTGIHASSGFGSTVAGSGDVDADGVGDLMVGAPAAQGYLGQAWVFSGTDGSLLHVFTGVQPPSPVASFGRALAGIGDIDQDGNDDVAVGALDENPVGSGSVRAYSGRTGEVLWTQFGEPMWRLGASIARIGTAADGTSILAIGAVGGPSLPGFVRIVSAKDGSVIATLDGSQNQSYFGGAIAALEDYDLDGVDDFVVGAPAQYAPPSGTGVIHLISGGDFSTLATVHPTAYSSQGQSLAGLSDLNGDGIPDFVTGSALNNIPANSAGYVRVFLGGCAAPSTYCTAKVNSQGCTPVIEPSGAPSLTVGNAFRILARGIINRQFGLLAWSAAPDVKPFFGGTLCMASPVIRTPVQWSGGSPPPAVDCTGTFDFHFSQAYMGQFLIAPGITLHGQYWYRDPFHIDELGVGLTDALSFEICL